MVVKPFTPLGNEVLTINALVPLQNTDGTEVRDAYNKVRYQAVPTSVPGCSFREVSSTEHDSDMHPTDVVARAMLPPTYPAPDGALVPTPTPAADTPVTWARNGKTYVLQGPSRLIEDLAGDLDHITFIGRLRSG